MDTVVFFTAVIGPPAILIVLFLVLGCSACHKYKDICHDPGIITTMTAEDHHTDLNGPAHDFAEIGTNNASVDYGHQSVFHDSAPKNHYLSHFMMNAACHEFGGTFDAGYGGGDIDAGGAGDSGACDGGCADGGCAD